MPRRCACIDVGANTTRLLVADVVPGGAPVEVHSERALLPLRPDAAGRLGADVGDRLRAVLAGQLRVARGLGAERVRVVATGGLRAAADHAAFLAGVSDEVEVITGTEEARLAFSGATAGQSIGGLVGVVDAGGASTEIAVGTCHGGPSWASSVPVGSAALTFEHLREDPPAPAELRALRDAADAALEGLDPPRPGTVLAVGGVRGSLRLLCGDRLDDDVLERALRTLTGAPCLEVAARTGLRPDRVRLLPAALALLSAAGRRLGAPPRFASGGLREGVCVDLALARPDA